MKHALVLVEAEFSTQQFLLPRCFNLLDFLGVRINNFQNCSLKVLKIQSLQFDVSPVASSLVFAKTPPQTLFSFCRSHVLFSCLFANQQINSSGVLENLLPRRRNVFDLVDVTDKTGKARKYFVFNFRSDL